MIILLIIFAVSGVLGVFLMNRDEPIGELFLGLGIIGCLICSVMAFSFTQSIKTLREQIKNVQYLTALDVAKINKEIAHIKAHPFMYSMLDTEGLEYISLDNAEAIPLKDVTK